MPKFQRLIHESGKRKAEKTVQKEKEETQKNQKYERHDHVVHHCVSYCLHARHTVRGLRKRLKKPSAKTISLEQMNMIYDTLSKHNRRNTISKAEHIANIEKMKNNIANNICPRCGSPLVLRHGKYGNFMGCSRYPQCHFIKKE